MYFRTLKEQLRHWVIIDLHEFRGWLTPDRINAAYLIDKRDGTFGRAFPIRGIASMIVRESETMHAALEHGMQVIQPLPSGPPRLTTFPPQINGVRTADGRLLQGLIDTTLPDGTLIKGKYARWDMIPDDAWAAYDKECAQWYAAHRANQTVTKT